VGQGSPLKEAAWAAVVRHAKGTNPNPSSDASLGTLPCPTGLPPGLGLRAWIGLRTSLNL